MRDLTSEAERAVLACVLMTGGKCLDEMPITGADFADSVLGEVFDAAARVWAAGNPVDSFRLSELPLCLRSYMQLQFTYETREYPAR